MIEQYTPEHTSKGVSFNGYQGLAPSSGLSWTLSVKPQLLFVTPSCLQTQYHLVTYTL